MRLVTGLVFLISLWIVHAADFPEKYNQFSPRILVSGVTDTSDRPVYLVRSWLNELGLIQLKSQIRQAKYMTTMNGSLLFELKTALQAVQVVDTWRRLQAKGVLSGLKANQTDIDFFNDFPRNEFEGDS